MKYAIQRISQKGEEKRVKQGHSWVYANEVARIEGKDKNGSLASVYSYDGKFIGKGYINHLSKILVRIFIRDEYQSDDKDFYLNRIIDANQTRVNLGYDNCYRMVLPKRTVSLPSSSTNTTIFWCVSSSLSA